VPSVNSGDQSAVDSDEQSEVNSEDQPAVNSGDQPASQPEEPGSLPPADLTPLGLPPGQPTASGTRLAELAQARWWPGNALEYFAIAVIVVLLAAGVVVTVVATIGQTVSSINIQWALEFGVPMLNVLAFMGGAVAYRRRQFASLDFVLRRLHGQSLDGLNVAIDTVTAVASVVIAWAGWQFAVGQEGQIDQFLHVSTFWLDLPLPIGIGLVSVFAVERVVVRFSLRNLPALVAGIVVGVALFVVAVVLQHGVLAYPSTTTIIVLMAIVAVVLLAMGMPLPLAFCESALLYAYFADQPFSVLPSDLLDGASSDTIYIAIPFFILAGLVMSEGGLVRRLTDAAEVVVGRRRGGVLQVLVVSMFVFSGLSGAKIADVVAVSTSAKHLARRGGYTVPEAMAVLCAGAAMGDTIPPSIGLIVLASVSTLSVGALFAAGLLPAVVMGIALMVLIRIRYRNHPVSEARPSARAKGAALLRGVPILAVPVFLILTISLGLATPSNSSAVTVVLALIVLLIAEQKIHGRALWRSLIDSANLAGVVLFILASATLFSRALTLANLPQSLANLVANGDIGGRWGFLIISSIILVIMGMIMEGLPAILILAPLFMPIAATLGINPLQYGIISVVCIGIGASSPPIGVGLFVSAQAGGVNVREVAKPLRPFLLALYCGLLVILAVPEISLWIPNALHIS
jgi:tripartite ATP-independent transporter DctM subunit